MRNGSSNSHDTLPNPANLMPPMRTRILYAARCKAGVAIADFVKISEFWSEYCRAKCLFCQSSKPNELILTQCSTILFA